MKLAELKKSIDKAYKRAGKCAKSVNVEFYCRQTLLEVEHIGQFHIAPDVVFHFKKHRYYQKGKK
jgi:hypothetical protein